MELIDKRALMYQLHKQSQIDSQPRAIRRSRRIVEECPTVEAIPVEWIEKWLSDRSVCLERTASEIDIKQMIEGWRAEQEKQNDS